MPTIFEEVVTSRISRRKMKHKPTLLNVGRVTSREMFSFAPLIVYPTSSTSGLLQMP
ncbi:hypothetical protein M378DRAFT_172991, partial [Amanita muscaria Koide BX008]